MTKDTDRGITIDHDDIEQTIGIQVTDARASTAGIEGKPGKCPGFFEFSIVSGKQEIVRIKRCEVAHAFNIAFGNEKILPCVIVDIAKACMPASTRFEISADIGSMGSSASVPGDIGERGPILLACFDGV